MPNAATLPLLLKQLALPSMYANWETAAKQAEKNHWSYPEYLTVLSDQEAVIRQQKRIQRHLNLKSSVNPTNLHEVSILT